ncbi:leucine-rich repeat neuronal protein 4-like [Oncorhynchus kisutch]|nr:leucine-rich repeat neuronal protein 4-like [Oncorhynchus kisutch]
MMSFCWNLAAMLLLLLLTPDLLPTRLINTRPVLTHAIPTSPPVTYPKIQYVTGVGFDYDEDDYTEEDASHFPPNHRKSPSASTLVPMQSKPCDYHPCQDNQLPCSQLSAQTGCLCPGLSGAGEPPHAPHLQKLVPGANGGAEIRWCAPASVVSGYRVVIEDRRGEPLQFGSYSRSGVLGELEAGVKVCVEAVNMAGASAPSKLSCLHYDPPEATNLALRAGVIGGGLGFLLLLFLVTLVLWRRQTCKTGENSAKGLGNPSYSKEGTL